MTPDDTQPSHPPATEALTLECAVPVCAKCGAIVDKGKCLSCGAPEVAPCPTCTNGSRLTCNYPYGCAHACHNKAPEAAQPAGEAHSTCCDLGRVHCVNDRGIWCLDFEGRRFSIVACPFCGMRLDAEPASAEGADVVALLDAAKLEAGGHGHHLEDYSPADFDRAIAAVEQMARDNQRLTVERDHAERERMDARNALALRLPEVEADRDALRHMAQREAAVASVVRDERDALRIELTAAEHDRDGYHVERDRYRDGYEELRARVGQAERELNQANGHWPEIQRLRTGITAAEAARDEARKTALEEAARIAAEGGEHVRHVYANGRPRNDFDDGRRAASNYAVEAIRALLAPRAGKTGESA